MFGYLGINLTFCFGNSTGVLLSIFFPNDSSGSKMIRPSTVVIQCTVYDGGMHETLEEPEGRTGATECKYCMKIFYLFKSVI